MAAVDGLVIIDKPSGWTSHDVVARSRRLLGTRRVGHAGTLDPMATGVLVLGVGRATRLLGRLALADKSYEATIRFGQSTITDDAEGDVIATVDAADVPNEAIAAAVADLTGDIEQRPSAVSAIKVAGVRSYKRVRTGDDVVLAPRPVTVSRFDVLAVRRSAGLVEVDVFVECSTGTYVRALARDAGAALGVGGHLSRLRRLRVGGYTSAQAQPLAVPDGGALVVVPMSQVARDNFPGHQVTAGEEAAVRVGRSLPVDLEALGEVALFNGSGEFLALYEQHGPLAKAVAVFTG